MACCNDLLWCTRHIRHWRRDGPDGIHLYPSLLFAKGQQAMGRTKDYGADTEGVLAILLLCGGLLRNTTVCVVVVLCQVHGG